MTEYDRLYDAAYYAVRRALIDLRTSQLRRLAGSPAFTEGEPILLDAIKDEIAHREGE
jgi:hypothetical protein